MSGGCFGGCLGGYLDDAWGVSWVVSAECQGCLGVSWVLGCFGGFLGGCLGECLEGVLGTSMVLNMTNFESTVYLVLFLCTISNNC